MDILTAINGFPLFCQNAPIYLKIAIYSENGSLSPLVTSAFLKTNDILTDINGFLLFSQNAPIYLKIGISIKMGRLVQISSAARFEVLNAIGIRCRTQRDFKFQLPYL